MPACLLSRADTPAVLTRTPIAAVPALELRNAYRNNYAVTVTDKDGRRYEGVVVWDYIRLVTEAFEEGRFQLQGPGGGIPLCTSRLESVKGLD